MMKPFVQIHASLTIGHLRELVTLSNHLPDNSNVEALVMADVGWSLVTALRTDKS